MAQEMQVSMMFTAKDEASAQIKLLEVQFQHLQLAVAETNKQLASLGNTGIGKALVAEIKATQTVQKAAIAEERVLKTAARAEEKAAIAATAAEEKVVKLAAVSATKAMLLEEKALKAAARAEEKAARTTALAEEKAAKKAIVDAEKSALAARTASQSAHVSQVIDHAAMGAAAFKPASQSPEQLAAEQAELEAIRTRRAEEKLLAADTAEKAKALEKSTVATAVKSAAVAELNGVEIRAAVQSGKKTSLTLAENEALNKLASAETKYLQALKNQSALRNTQDTEKALKDVNRESENARKLARDMEVEVQRMGVIQTNAEAFGERRVAKAEANMQRMGVIQTQAEELGARSAAKAEAEVQRMGKIHFNAEQMEAKRLKDLVAIKQQQDLWQGARNKEMAAFGGSASEASIAAAAAAMGKYGYAVKSVTAVEQVETSSIQAVVDKYDVLGAKLRRLQAEKAILMAAPVGTVNTAIHTELDKNISAATEAVKKFGLAHADTIPHVKGSSLAIREFLVMIRELSRGDMTRFAGSFSIFLGTFKNLSLLNIATNPITLITVALGAFYFAAIKGAQAQAQLHDAIASTGDFAGMTERSMQTLADSISKSGTLTIGTAKDVVTQLVASGRIGSQALTDVAGLAETMSRVTGKTAEETAAQLIKLFADPKKGAEELNATMHDLDGTDLKYIDTLIKSNKEGEAQKFLADKTQAAMGEVTKGIKDQINWLDKGVKSWSAFWAGTLRGAAISANLVTPDNVTKLADAQERLARLQATQTHPLLGMGTAAVSGMGKHGVMGAVGGATSAMVDALAAKSTEKAISDTQAEIATLQGKVKAEESAALATKKTAEANKISAQYQKDYEATTKGSIDGLKTKITATESYLSSRKAMLDKGSADDQARAKTDVYNTATVLEDQKKLLKSLEKSLSPHTHITANVAEDVVTIAQAKAAMEWRKNALQQEEELAQRQLGDETISHTERLQKHRELIVKKRDLYVEELEIEKKAVLDKANLEAAAKRASGGEGSAQEAGNILARGRAKAEELSMQQKILGENARISLEDKSGDTKAEKEDRLKAAKDVVAAIKLEELKALDDVKAREQGMKSGAALGTVPKAKELQQLKAFSVEKDRIEQDSLAKQLKAYKEGDDGYAKILQDQVKLKAAQALELAKIETDIALEQNSKVKEVTDNMTSGIAKMMTDVVMHTTTVKKAFADMVKSITTNITGMVSQNLSKSLMDVMGLGAKGQADGAAGGGNPVMSILQMILGKGGTGGAGGKNEFSTLFGLLGGGGGGAGVSTEMSGGAARGGSSMPSQQTPGAASGVSAAIGSAVDTGANAALQNTVGGSLPTGLIGGLWSKVTSLFGGSAAATNQGPPTSDSLGGQAAGALVNMGSGSAANTGGSSAIVEGRLTDALTKTVTILNAVNLSLNALTPAIQNLGSAMAGDSSAVAQLNATMLANKGGGGGGGGVGIDPIQLLMSGYDQLHSMFSQGGLFGTPNAELPGSTGGLLSGLGLVPSGGVSSLFGPSGGGLSGMFGSGGGGTPSLLPSAVGGGGGSLMGDLSASSILPSFAVGTNYVPQDMIAMIHKGEKIVPAAYNNPKSQGGASTVQHLNFNFSQPEQTATQLQLASVMQNAMRQATNRNM